MIASLLLAVGLAAPACTEELAPPTADSVSLAWVKPKGRRLSGTVRAVSTVALRQWLAGQPSADVTRVVQGLGIRRKAVRGDWEVVIVEATPSEICRPLPEGSDAVVAGVARCAKPAGGDIACGKARDFGDAERPSLDVFQVPWPTVAARGHCVLPAERFLRELR